MTHSTFPHARWEPAEPLPGTRTVHDVEPLAVLNAIARGWTPEEIQRGRATASPAWVALIEQISSRPLERDEAADHLRILLDALETA